MTKFSLSVMLFAVLCSMVGADSIDDRLSYLEYQLTKETFKFNKEIFTLKQMMKGRKQNNDSSNDTPDKLAERIKIMETRVDTFLMEQQKKHRALRLGFQDLKKSSHERFVRLESAKNDNADIKGIIDKLNDVSERVETEESERAEMKQEINNDIKAVLGKLDEKVAKLNIELDAAVKNIQNVSSMTSLVVDGRKLQLTACEEGWTLLNRKCYLYTPDDDKLDWHGASIKCFMKGGKLAEPETEAEMQAVLGMVGNNVWLGGTDAAEEGTWLWDSTQMPVKHLIWEKGQPNNLQGSQDCLEAYSKQLNDEECAAKASYICEKKASKYA